MIPEQIRELLELDPGVPIEKARSVARERLHEITKQQQSLPQRNPAQIPLSRQFERMNAVLVELAQLEVEQACDEAQDALDGLPSKPEEARSTLREVKAVAVGLPPEDALWLRWKQMTHELEFRERSLRVEKLCALAQDALNGLPPNLQAARTTLQESQEAAAGLPPENRAWPKLNGLIHAIKLVEKGILVEQLCDAALSVLVSDRTRALAKYQEAQAAADDLPDGHLARKKLAVVAEKFREDDEVPEHLRLMAKQAVANGDVLAVVAIYREHLKYAAFWVGFFSEAFRARLRRSREESAGAFERVPLEQLHALHEQIRGAISQLRSDERSTEHHKAINRCDEENEEIIKDLRKLLCLAGSLGPVQPLPASVEAPLRELITTLAGKAWQPEQLDALRAILGQEAHQRVLAENEPLKQELEALMTGAERVVAAAGALMKKLTDQTNEIRSFVASGQKDKARGVVVRLQGLADDTQSLALRGERDELNRAVESLLKKSWTLIEGSPWWFWPAVGTAVIVGVALMVWPKTELPPKGGVDQGVKSQSATDGKTKPTPKQDPQPGGVTKDVTGAPRPSTTPKVPPKVANPTGILMLQSAPAIVDFGISRNGQSFTNGSQVTADSRQFIVPVGQYQVRLNRGGHSPFSTNALVSEGKIVEVSHIFPEGQIVLKSIEPGVQFEVIQAGAKGTNIPAWTGITPSSPVSLPVGEYVLMLRRTGYRKITNTVTVSVASSFLLPSQTWVSTSAPRKSPEVPPQPALGAFRIVSLPVGANVETSVPGMGTKRAGEVFGDVKPGTYEVTVILTNYVTRKTNVVITASVTNNVTVKLDPVTGSLALPSQPVVLNYRVLDSGGNEVGAGRTGGAPLLLKAGDYQVVFTRTWGNYLNVEATEPVTVRSNQTSTAQHVFDEGIVRFVSDSPRVQIKLGGTNTIGETTPEKPLELPFPAGQHRLIASLGSLPTKSKTLAVASGSAQMAQFDFMGRALISSIPPGAEVWLDGVRQSAPPVGGHEMLEGTHEVELRLTGHASLKTNVVISAGLINRVMENRNLTALLIPPPTNAQRWTNGLNMGFARVGKVLFCVHETRVRDFASFAKESELAWQPEGGPPAGPQGPTHPAVNISWEMARDFCVWLSTRERGEGRIASGQRYRLPTDEEWSTAVGLGPEAGATPSERLKNTPRDQGPWGQFNPQVDFTPPLHVGNYGPATRHDGHTGTAPVGSFKANQFGLYDMGGNAEEWCSDLFGAGEGVHPMRGGGWMTQPQKPPNSMFFFISGYRFPGAIPTLNVGFRPVLDFGN